MSQIYLIVGLGNPGAKYQQSRHNVGWWVVDLLARRYDLGSGRSERRALTWDGSVEGRRVKLAKPLTYMNRSGEALRALMDYYEIPLERLIVIHDDLDTPFGILKLRKSGGHGGQNGLRSIIQHLGSRDFARLRFGIDRPPGRMDPVDYVLQPFRGPDHERALELAARSADAIECWLRDGIEIAMSSFNGAAGRADASNSAVNLVEKLAVLQRAHELSPSDPRALSQLIAVQKKLGQLDVAVANHLKLAQLHDDAGDARRAISEKVKAVTIQPSLVGLQRQIAQWYHDNNNSKKAVARYLILAAHFRDRDDIAAARAAVDAALELNPQHPKALSVRDELRTMQAST